MGSSNEIPHTLASQARAYMRSHGVRYQQALAAVTKPAASTTQGSVWLRALGIDDIESYDARAVWEAAPIDGIRTPIGFSCDKADIEIMTDGLFEIDLAAESNVIIQGMTGSGKSTLERSLVGSTAALNGPDMVQFLLLAFKSTHTFDGCDKVPHVAGVFTRLDVYPAVVEMLKGALEQELSRRRDLLDRHEVPDAHRYRRLRATDASLAALPELIVVVDEASEYLKQYPEHWSLVGLILEEGAALGVHLVHGVQDIGITNQAELRQLREHVSLGVSLRTNSLRASRLVVGDETAWGLPVGGGVARARAWAPAITEARTLRVFDVWQPDMSGQSGWSVLLERLSQFTSKAGREFAAILTSVEEAAAAGAAR